VTLMGCEQTSGPGPIGTQPQKTALLVIDVQDCFLEGGSLAVPASHIIEKINMMGQNKACLFGETVYTQDYHPENHISFASTHGLQPFAHLGGKGSLPLTCIKPSSGLTQDAACCPTVYVDPSSVNCTEKLCPPDGWDYDVNNSDIVQNEACTSCRSDPDSCYQTTQEMWTDHCLQSGDSNLSSSLIMSSSPKIVRKGMNQFVDAYSGFMDNSRTVETELDSELLQNSITDLVVVGIATDVCVLQSVIDAIAYGYTVTVVSDATAAVLGNQANFDKAVADMQAAGATIKTVEEIMAQECPAEVAAGMV